MTLTLFPTLNQSCPPSVSQKDVFHSEVKPQLHEILEQGTNTKYEQPNADTVDDTTLINILFSEKVQSSKMPDGYATEVIVPQTE